MSDKRELCRRLKQVLNNLLGGAKLSPAKAPHKRLLKPKLAKLTIPEVAAIARKQGLSYGQIVANDYEEALKNMEEEKE